MNHVECKICLKKIKLAKDDYVHVEDYGKGQFEGEGYYHRKCYLDRINRVTPLTKMAVALAGRANRMMDKAEGKEPTKEFIIG